MNLHFLRVISPLYVNVMCLRFRLAGVVMAFVLFSPSAWAQSTADTENCYPITVLDKASGKPLQGVRVSMEGALAGVITDKDGKAQVCFSTPPDEKQALTVQVEDFGFVYYKVVPDGGDILVNSSGVNIDNITIVGIEGVQRQARKGLQVQSISAGRLFTDNAASIYETISKMNGVSMLTSGNGIRKLSVRGMASNRLGIVIDGIKVENQQWGDDHGINLDEQLLERVEIIKTAQSLLYGSDAMGGVVNFVQKDHLVDNSIRGNVKSIFRSNDGMTDNHIDLAGKWKNISVGGYLNGRLTHDYQNPVDGFVQGSRYRQINYGGYVFAKKTWGEIRLKYNQYATTAGVPNEELRDSASGKFPTAESNQRYGYSIDQWGPEGSFLFNRQCNASLLAKYDASPHKYLRFSLNWQQNLRQEFGPEHENQEGEEHGEEEHHEHHGEGLFKHLEFDLHTINYNLTYHGEKLHSDNQSTFSQDIALTGSTQINRVGGEEFLIPAYRSQYVGLVWIGDWKKKIGQSTVNVSAGVRGDYTNLHTNQLTQDPNKFVSLLRNYLNLSGNLSFHYHYDETFKLDATFARGFRVPQVSELLSNGAHEGTQRFEIGNHNLKPEHNYQVDLAMAYTAPSFDIRADVFYNHINNFIFARKLLTSIGADSMVAEDKVFKYDQQTAFITGIEGEVDIHPTTVRWFHFLNRFAYLYGAFHQSIESVNFMPRIAAPRWLSELRFDVPIPSALLRNLTYVLESIYTFQQDRFFSAYGTETLTPAYWLVNTGVGFRFYAQNRNVLNVFLSVNNMLNVAYQDHLSLFKYVGEPFTQGDKTFRGIYNMARNVSVKLHIPLQYKF